jgi:hypothetical protein
MLAKPLFQAAYFVRWYATCTTRSTAGALAQAATAEKRGWHRKGRWRRIKSDKRQGCAPDFPAVIANLKATATFQDLVDAGQQLEETPAPKRKAPQMRGFFLA